MSNTFNINRFGKYFKYDLFNARNQFGLSLLILGCLPIIAFVFTELFSVLFLQEWAGNVVPARVLAIIAAVLVTIITFPAKAYGKLTEKKAGSNWILLPASVFEKWLSMMIINMIVLPACLFGLLLLSDTLLALCFPAQYGNHLLSTEGFNMFKMMEPGDDNFSFNLSGVVFFDWCNNILIFTLGAIFFKKSKAGKTILCLFLFGCIVGSIFAAIFGTANLDNDDLARIFRNWTINDAFRAINIFVNACYLIMMGLVSAALYFRMKTIKH